MKTRSSSVGGFSMWPALCLSFFGCVIGTMAALNEQVGSTATLIAALFTLIGGSLTALYRPPNLDDAAREWIVKAIGAISIGLLVGLLFGFFLRYLDQAVLMTKVARNRAELDRELRTHGQRLADYWGESQEKGKPKDKDDAKKGEPQKQIPAPTPSITLRAGIEELRQKVVKDLNEAIGRIETEKGSAEEKQSMTRLKGRVKQYRDTIDRPNDHSSEVWLANVDLAAEAMAGLRENSVEKSLRDLRAQAVQK